MPDLYERSLTVIGAGQAPSGAFVASPNFGTYKYSWLRDGCFIAYGADRAGRHDRAARFFRWVDRTLQQFRERVDTLIARASRGEPIGDDEWLHCRFTLEGEEGLEPWGNHQLDGYGTYLWALCQHARLSGNAAILSELRPSLDLTVRYLLTFWDRPNHDCWEENGEYIHPSTLACIYGGLTALGEQRADPTLVMMAQRIQKKVLSQFVHDGYLRKFADGRSIDANLLWVSTPFRLLEPDDPIMVRTVEELQRRLWRGGGVRRYPEDTYYGGGEWILLTAWLGWYYCEAGRLDRAGELLRWIEENATDEGDLPEQVPASLNAPARLEYWIDRWGPIATPLLWSHAMYIVLRDELVRYSATGAAG
jgi:GH15 family glucan-1,4-alpha-glucosidase